MDDLAFTDSASVEYNNHGTLLLMHMPALVYHSIHRVNGLLFRLHKEQIQDIFQEFFFPSLKIITEKLRTFQAKNGCTLASRLKQVAVNLTIDYLRTYRMSISLDEASDEGRSLKDVLPTLGPSADESLIDSEQLEHLKECIEALDVDEKYFMVLHIEEEVPLGELRHYLGVSRGTVDMRKSRIIERLRECFKRKGFLLDL